MESLTCRKGQSSTCTYRYVFRASLDPCRCKNALHVVLFSVVDSGEDTGDDLSPAFAPGSYFPNIVENSITTRGMLILDVTINDNYYFITISDKKNSNERPFVQ